jgi:glucose-6-phosphate 1-dehydrogenase
MNIDREPSTLVLFGATGDLAVKKIFPALEALSLAGNQNMPTRIVGVGRRDWEAPDLLAFLEEGRGSAYDAEFASTIEYAKVDIADHSGYEALASLIDGPVTVYLSLAPQHHKAVIENLMEERILTQGEGKILIEKPFGVDEASARDLNELLSEFLNEEQIYRIDHYLGKDSLRAVMDIHERTPAFDRLLSAQYVASIRVSMREDIGIFGRGASYDGVGAFRDVGQNHVLEMLAVLVADVPEQTGETARGHMWQLARASVLGRLDAPQGTCELLRRGQYEGYLSETGVSADSQTETAFEVFTSFTSGKLAGVPITLQGGKKLGSSEVLMEVLFKDSPDLPKSIVVYVQPRQEIVTTERDGSTEAFVVPKVADAYANVLADAFAGQERDFVGAEEVRHLWRYTDRVVACWEKVPLEAYGDDAPFLIQ